MRDSDGKALAMMCDSLDLIQDPVLAEVLAARRAVELCLLMGIRKIILEGDSLQVVQALQASKGGHSIIGPIVEDAQHLCRRFSVFTLQHVPRGANGEAHNLAKLAFLREGHTVWRDNFPLP